MDKKAWGKYLDGVIARLKKINCPTAWLEKLKQYAPPKIFNRGKDTGGINQPEYKNAKDQLYLPESFFENGRLKDIASLESGDFAKLVHELWHVWYDWVPWWLTDWWIWYKQEEGLGHYIEDIIAAKELALSQIKYIDPNLTDKEKKEIETYNKDYDELLKKKIEAAKRAHGKPGGGTYAPVTPELRRRFEKELEPDPTKKNNPPSFEDALPAPAPPPAHSKQECPEKNK
jgi:hypothetical protein